MFLNGSATCSVKSFFGRRELQKEKLQNNVQHLEYLEAKQPYLCLPPTAVPSPSEAGTCRSCSWLRQYACMCYFTVTSWG